MQKTKGVLAALIISGVARAAFSQGIVQFRNYAFNTTPAVDAPISEPDGTLLSGANPDYRVALVGGLAATGDPWGLRHRGNLGLCYYPADTTLTWVNFGTGTSPASDAPGYARVGTRAARAVPGSWDNAEVLLQVVAWDGPETTWEQAWQDAQFGNVRIGVSNTLSTQTQIEMSFVYLWGLQAFHIDYVPEPNTFVLAALGAGGLLTLRRRN